MAPGPEHGHGNGDDHDRRPDDRVAQPVPAEFAFQSAWP